LIQSNAEIRALTTRVDLQETELAHTKAELAHTKAELAHTNAELAHTNAELAHTNAKLAKSEAEIRVLTTRVDLQETDLAQSKAESSALTTRVDLQETELTQNRSELDQAKAELTQMKKYSFIWQPKLAGLELKLVVACYFLASGDFLQVTQACMQHWMRRNRDKELPLQS
jgi:chromosome segregation ATPase